MNNRGATPALLMTTLKLLKENVDEKNVDYNGQNGFIIFLLKTDTCGRLLNYYKRSEALRLVYEYINKPKNLLSWFRNKPDRIHEAKDLAVRLEITPIQSIHSSTKWGNHLYLEQANLMQQSAG